MTWRSGSRLQLGEPGVYQGQRLLSEACDARNAPSANCDGPR